MNDLASDFGLRKPSDLGVVNTMDFGGDASLQSAPSNILTLPKPKRTKPCSLMSVYLV